ncbi:hypothetical protein [Rhodococcus aetherivorans]
MTTTQQTPGDAVAPASQSDRAPNPYRVVIWGTGNLGRAALRELIRRPEIDVVAVLGHNPSRHGTDAGESILGGAKIGIPVTTNKDDIYAMRDVDCVLHMATVTPDMTDDVVRLLETGKNVISSAGFHNPAYHGEEFVARLEKACALGNSSLCGNGLHPNLMFERLTLASTALTSRVEHISFAEYADCSAIGPEGEGILRRVGLGATPEVLQAALAQNPIEDSWLAQYYVESLHFVLNKIFGITPAEMSTTIDVDWDLAPADMETNVMKIHKGEVMAIRNTYKAHIDGVLRGTMHEYYYLGDQACPLNDRVGETTHIAVVKGDPTSYQMRFDAGGSLRPSVERSDDSTAAAAYICVMPIIQAVPKVTSAPAGIIMPEEFSYAASDLHSLAPILN